MAIIGNIPYFQTNPVGYPPIFFNNPITSSSRAGFFHRRLSSSTTIGWPRALIESAESAFVGPRAIPFHTCLVVDLPSEKWWTSSVGMMKFPRYSQKISQDDGKVIQNSMVPVTTNQPFISFYVVLMEVMVGLQDLPSVCLMKSTTAWTVHRSTAL